jgi:hypothetical protein
VVVKEEIVNYARNDIIETENDLSALFDKKGNPPKFQELVEGVNDPSRAVDPLLQKPGESNADYRARMLEFARAATQAAEGAEHSHPGTVGPVAKRPAPDMSTLESMNLDELRKWAESEEINLGNATKKPEILKAIKAALEK